MFYFTKTPFWLKMLYPTCLWNHKPDGTQKKIYLSFDDGPHVTATPFVLDELKKYNARATFFCIGKNVLAEPLLYKRILLEGHRVGNHTQNHLNGWKTDNETYLGNIENARKLIDSNLFRPPYGKATAFQIRNLIEKLQYKVVMWDVLAGDFDPKVNGTQAAQRVVQKSKSGSIIVFHDSAKAFEVLQVALPIVLSYFSGQGFSFETIK
ncbi:MAG TPA: polysaccharide deacetylase family protein [Puia sp.]|nr:polysaccharide deacetylase family protein [Puia sp.]